MCDWDPDMRMCILASPPSSIIFTLLVTLMVLLVVVPVEGEISRARHW